MVARQFLVFRLAGPMAAFGDIAVGERRSIWGEPSKSAVLGLLAAALGHEREETQAHRRLDEGLGFAVRIDQPGRPLRDYHTAQAPKARKGVRWRTRQEEVKDRLELYTVLSERLYRVEAVATVALWPRAGASIALDALAQALGRPRFCLYLGRKSCPLGEPTRPKVIEADALPEAFALYDDARRSEAAANPDVPGAASAPPDAPIWFELDAGLTTEEAGVDLIRQRRDGVRSRVLRQFSDRREARLGRAQPHPDPLQGIVS